jgi:hypothetical protein
LNKYFVKTIYGILSTGIDKSYKTGIESIISQNKKKFKKLNKFFANELIYFGSRNERGGNRIFKIDYSGKDLKAIHNFKKNAFQVSGVGSWELEEELKKLGVSVMDNTIPDYNSFELAVRQKMQQYGIGLGDQPPSGWIKQNLDHAMKNSMAGARWLRVTDPQLKGLYTAWVYHTQEDDRVRPAHQVLDGKVFSMDDPVAAKMIPPVDWGCRCFEDYITHNEASDMDIADNSDELITEVPPDFRYNPGIDQDIWGKWLEQKYPDMPARDLAQLKAMMKQNGFN